MKKTAEKTSVKINDVSGKFFVLSFAEQVHYPSNLSKLVQFIFKTASKCGIFGIYNDRTHSQINYFIDEEDI